MKSVFITVVFFFCAVTASFAAEAPQIVFLGVWDRSAPLLDAAARELKLNIAYYSPAEVLADGSVAQKRTEPCGLIYILNLESGQAMALTRWFNQRAGKQKIIPLDQRGSHADLEKAGLLTHDEEVPRYWRANGAANMRRLLEYTSVRYLGRAGKIQPAIVVPDFGYYEPGREEPFSNIAEVRTYKQENGRWTEGAPVAALLTQQSFWVTRDTKVLDAQVRALEAHGINSVIIFGDTQAMVENLIRETKPDILIEDRHGAMWDSRRVLESLDVPYLRPISMMGSTIDEWKKNPQGLTYRDVGMFLTVQESWGTLEPIVVGGMHANISGFHLHEAIPDRVERFAARTASWLNLRKKSNADKRVAIVYYNKGLGKDDLMRGSPTGAFMNGPESAVRFLPRMKERGYTVSPLPKDSKELIGWMQERGRNIGPWSRGELEQLVRARNPVLIPASRYSEWFRSKLSPANQQAVIKAFGPPPGKLMVVERNGQKYIVIPRLALGNIILAPQPERGATQDDKLLHSRDVPPPHNYLAFYWWLQKEFHADAVIHWGTHGSLELLPGKESGLSRDDWTDICVGNMPIVDLWIMDNIAEATLSRRRSYAQLVDHMVPPIARAGLETAHAALRSDLDKFSALEPGLLKEAYRKQITEAALREGIAAKLQIKSTGLLNDENIERVADFIREVNESRTPLSLHVLGQSIAEKDMYPYLVAILGNKFLEHIEAVWPPPSAQNDLIKRQWLEDKGREFLIAHGSGSQEATANLTPDLIKDLDFARRMRERLNDADQEIVGLLRALEGRYIQPGPGPEPVRNPDSVPGGRNLYALNPEEVPTKPAWDVAVRLVDELLRRKHPRKVGLDLNGMDTMRDFGVMEAQILYLMGVRPVWDRNGLATDVELIPQSELKRPRVDVFIAMGGQYKENFTTRVKLLDKAVRLVSALNESDNYVREGTLANERGLKAKGFSSEQARHLAPARIFGTKPGNMSGTHILYLVPRSGVWDKDDQVADVYVDNMSYAYTGDVWGQKIDPLFKQAIQGTEVVVRVWASNMTSQLSNHHAYEYLGGLSMAVAKLTGREPEAFIADVRDPNGARIRDFNEVIATNLASELLNKKWIEGMKEHGYAGAGHAAELVKNTFGWTVTRKHSISDAQWNDIYSVYVQDRYQLGLRAWMKNTNPHALQEMTATMLEAARKGYWSADAQKISQLSTLYAELAVRYGDSEGLVSGGNRRLQEYVSGVLQSAGTAPGKALAQQMAAALAKSEGRSSPISRAAPVSAPALSPAPPRSQPGLQTVIGQRLERIAQQVARPAKALPPPARFGYEYLLAGLFCLTLLAYGFVLRTGVI